MGSKLPKGTARCSYTKESFLAKEGCDFLEELCNGNYHTQVVITNWEVFPIQIGKGSILGELEQGIVVEQLV